MKLLEIVLKAENLKIGCLNLEDEWNEAAENLRHLGTKEKNEIENLNNFFSCDVLKDAKQESEEAERRYTEKHQEYLNFLKSLPDVEIELK